MTKEPSKGFLVQILPLKVKTIDGRTTTPYALLDNGSQSTFIRDDFAEGLKLKGYKKIISISSVIDEVEKVKVKEAFLRIQDMKEENELHISALTSKNMFNMSAQPILEKTRINQLKRLKGIKIHNVSAFDITILIDANAPEAFIQSEVRKGLANEPYTIKTASGWSLLGNKTSQNETNSANSKLSINRLDITTRDEMLHRLVKNFWETEDYLSTISREIAMNQEDKQCLNGLIEETKLVEGKYQVLMSWKSKTSE